MIFSKKNKDIEFLKELGYFLKSGYSLNEAIEFLKNDYNISCLCQNLNAGNSFAKSSSMLELGTEIKLLIMINEEQENLINGIKIGIELWDLNTKIKKELQEQLKYPLFLIIIVVIILFGINLLIVPQIIILYETFNLQFSISHLLVLNILKGLPWIGIGLVGIIGIWFIAKDKLNFEQKIKILTKLKLGSLYIEMYNQIFITYFVSMLKMNLSINTLLQILSNQNENQMLKSEAKRIRSLLNQGAMLNRTLEHRFYSKRTINIFEVGLRNNNLIRYLEMELLQQKNRQQIRQKQVLFWIQPVIYIIVGLIIIIIYSLIFNTIYGVLV